MKMIKIFLTGSIGGATALGVDALNLGGMDNAEGIVKILVQIGIGIATIVQLIRQRRQERKKK